MTVYCHRCSGALSEEDSFCPHCAAPQLLVEPQQNTSDVTASANLGTLDGGPRDRRGIDWRYVIRLALWVAVPVGLLSLVFFPLVILAPMLVISLYRRRRPGALVDGRSGFRIGALTGLLAAYVSAFGLACWQIFQRYSLHQGAAIDQQYVMRVQQSAEATQRMAQGNALTVQQARNLLDFFLSPDGRAAITLFDTAALASGIVLLAGLGGMLGARLSRRSTQPFSQQ
jgi:hypothetical protein